MVEYHRVKKYCEHYYNIQLRDSRVGLQLAIIGFTLFVYADIMVFNYPLIVTIMRVILIIYYTLALIITYLFEDKINLVRVVISGSCILALAFGAFIAVYIGKIMPEYFYRASQVFILITIGSILFAGVIKPYLNYIVGFNLIGYIIACFFVYGLDSNVLFSNFNVIFINITAMVFNYYFIRSRVNEYEAIVDNISKIDELKSEIITRQQLQYQLKEMATYDGLTKAYVRAIGLNMLEKQMFRADEEFKSISIIYLDVNGLKIVNDTYGHKIGDMYIVGLVDIINKTTRYKDYCIRLGGDEFLAVLPNTTFFEAEQIWRTIRTNIKDFVIEDHISVMPLQVSHGIAEYTSHNFPSIESFLDAADDKMYIEKKFIKKESIESNIELKLH